MNETKLWRFLYLFGPNLSLSGLTFFATTPLSDSTVVWHFGSPIILLMTVPVLEPVAVPFPAMRGAEIAGVFSGQQKGGDFYEVVRVSPSRVLFGLVELPSRLKPSRKIPSALRRIFCDAGTQLLKSAEANECDALIELFTQLNRFVIERGVRARSCPAFGGCYDEDLGTVCYFNAGHTPGLVRHSSGVSELASTSLPLGVFSHVTPDAGMIALEPGAVLLLVSQSVVVAEMKGEKYGLGRVGATLKDAHLASASDLCAVVLEGVQGFARKPQREAITALALIRESPEISMTERLLLRGVNSVVR